MKRIILITTLLLSSFSASSQVETIATKAKGNYYGRGSIGLLVGELASGSAQISNGYAFGCGLDVGLGLGYENYNYNRFAPLFLETRYHFGKRETKPFVGLIGGYMAGLNQYNNARGFTAGMQVGITHYFTKHFGITSSVGYRYIMTESTNIYYAQLHMSIMQPQMASANIHRIEARFGVVIR
ncbi:MAG: hypothetical protein V4604_03730 [Bacteroidota bacterium]